MQLAKRRVAIGLQSFRSGGDSLLGSLTCELQMMDKSSD